MCRRREGGLRYIESIFRVFRDPHYCGDVVIMKEEGRRVEVGCFSSAMERRGDV